MVDVGTSSVERRVLDDDSDDELSAFVNFLESPNALVPPARRRDPHVEIAEGGARLVGHFLHPTKDHGDDDSGEGTAVTSASRAERDGNALANEKNAAKKDKKNKKKASDIPPATISQVLSFLPTTEDRTMLALGILFAVGNGLVFPGLAFLFSTSFSDLSQASDGLDDTRVLVLQFVGIGFYGFVCAGLQNFFFLVVSHRASDNFKKQWFAALLRQDASFHDVHSVSGMATALSSASGKMKRGLGRKLGEGVQFGTCFLGGIVYAFYSSWRVALVILALLPFVSGAAFLLMQINQSQTSTAQKAYTSAGSTAYGAVSSIRTVLSLNAVPEMIRQYSTATLEAYRNGVGPLVKVGLVNGSMLGSFILLYAVLTLYGAYLMYTDVLNTQCDPSGAIDAMETCRSSGPAVFGAMLGVAFAAQGMSQTANSIEAVSGARAACAQAMMAINRTLGTEEKTVTVKVGTKKDENGEGEIDLEETYTLPKYLIDSSSHHGLKPKTTMGEVVFENVTFAYPTRPNNLIFKGLNLKIESGKTIALVGPSGGGKSTTIGLIERFYDPIGGRITLDGIDMKDLNVTHVRSQIGYVGQEPALFATTIENNIRYGKPDATREEIEEAAKRANAHDFISSFSDGYSTQVGDKGLQLSGGQKQRIAIARVLVGNPKLLLLDEATSALDSESELVVQEALDKLLATEKRTTIIIAHRLTTIRNADVIVVIAGGQVVEMGTHDSLMQRAGHYFSLVQKQEHSLESGAAAEDSRFAKNASEGNLAALPGSTVDLCALMNGKPQLTFSNVSFAYPTRPNKPILDKFSLTVKQGEVLALVGPSGGGKSTTIGLIERFYDTLAGSIEFEGVNIKELNVQWYRDQIGIVSQEPTLFAGTIAKNISYGAPKATRAEIEAAAAAANAHTFIMSFPKGYDTEVGEGGAQLSGGQKQRIAIARAIVKNPKVLLLDEATSALDSESERVVQAALDKLMASRDRTTIVIAHRLSTVRKADRIAFIAGGKLMEIGSHDELIEKTNGRYRRLVDSQKRSSTVSVADIKKDNQHTQEEEENVDFEKEELELASKAFDKRDAWKAALPEVKFYIVGAIGCALAGGVFPAWGIVFAELIGLLFYPAFPCEGSQSIAYGYPTCDAYYSSVADTIKEESYVIAVYWAGIIAACMVGNLLAFWGLGHATESINRRMRNLTFTSLMRQEVAYFDKRSVGSITSQLQEDATMIQAFSSEPIRTLVINLASVATGITISFIYMWPFALLSLLVIPFMGFATALEMKQFMGTDESTEAVEDGCDSPGGIIVETLLNIRTVSALTLEEQRLKDYEKALAKADGNTMKDSAIAGSLSGLSIGIQQWVNALQFWWGAWLMYKYPGAFTFNEFLVAMFALLFSLFSLGAAAQGLTDKKKAEAAAGRLFYIINRESAIDPLNPSGKKLS